MFFLCFVQLKLVGVRLQAKLHHCRWCFDFDDMFHGWSHNWTARPWEQQVGCELHHSSTQWSISAIDKGQKKICLPFFTQKFSKFQVITVRSFLVQQPGHSKSRQPFWRRRMESCSLVKSQGQWCRILWVSPITNYPILSNHWGILKNCLKDNIYWGWFIGKWMPIPPSAYETRYGQSAPTV